MFFVAKFTLLDLLLFEELVLGGGGGGAPLEFARGGQGGGSVEGCLTGLPTSVLGYEGRRPSGAFNKLVLLICGGGGGTAEQVELVLLTLFSLSEFESFKILSKPMFS